MPKSLKRILLLPIIFVCASASAAKAKCEDEMGFVMTRATEPGKFAGFTEAGLMKIEPELENLKVTMKNAPQNFQGMDAIFDLTYLTLMTHQNAYIGGLPGGAKTSYLLWLLGKSGLWSKLIHGMTQVSEVLGGQTKKAFEKGREGLNFKSTLVRSRYGLLEELANGNDLLLGALYNVLNPTERFYLYRGEPIPTNVESIFATGNLTPAEILEHFESSDVRGGPAALSRIIHTAWVSNWPSFEEMVAIDDTRLRLNHLKAVMEDGSREERANAAVLLKDFEARDVQWNILRRFARNAFVMDGELLLGTIDLARALRSNAVDKKIDSEEKHFQSPRTHRWVYDPNADWTERLRGSIIPDIINWAALDYLRTHTIEQIAALKQPIVLGRNSLWRAAAVETTIRSGSIRFDPVRRKVRFNLVRDSNGVLRERTEKELLAEATSLRGVDYIKQLNLSETQFNSILGNTLDKVQHTSQPVNQAMALFQASQAAQQKQLGPNEDPDEIALSNDLSRVDFETEIANLRGDRIQP